MTDTQRWQDWVGLILGAFMFFSPWIFTFTSAPLAAGSAFVLGAAAALFFLVALFSPRMWEEWINLALAVLMFLSPFVLQFTGVGAAAWTHWVIAVLIGIDAVWAMSEMPVQRESHQHG